jgi:phospholipase C
MRGKHNCRRGAPLGGVAMCALVISTFLTEGFAADKKTATPIKHLVIIYGENESFDHYFATYPVALNPPNEQPQFYLRDDTPSVTGCLPACLPTTRISSIP